MKIVTRITTMFAALAFAVIPAVVAVPAANAGASDCADALAAFPRFGGGGPGAERLVLTPSNRTLWGFANTGGSSVCVGAVVSMAISRYDAAGSDVRNVNARAYDSWRWFDVSFPMGWMDTGRWVMRQIAVFKDGRLVVRSFPMAAAPDYADISRASVLTGRLGDLVPTTVDGYLRAYSTRGTLVPMAPGRHVQVQIRPYRFVNEPYETVATAYTSASGYWRTQFRIPPCGRYDVRVVFVTPYRTIASDATWVGVVGVPC